ncbi:MAG TPA: hypothetical protein VF163_15365 [Micromonosporaceae bacterium]
MLGRRRPVPGRARRRSTTVLARTLTHVTALTLGTTLLSGCDRDAAADAGRRPPAAAAGAACQLIEYDLVANILGTRFDTAGGARKDATLTCALTQAEQPYPDLTLAVTASTASEVIFKATVEPSGSLPVKALGRTAYRLFPEPVRGGGPAVELGWLSAKNRIFVLRYTFPAEATDEQAQQLFPKMLTLARTIDKAA